MAPLSLARSATRTVTAPARRRPLSVGWSSAFAVKSAITCKAVISFFKKEVMAYRVSLVPLRPSVRNLRVLGCVRARTYLEHSKGFLAGVFVHRVGLRHDLAVQRASSVHERQGVARAAAPRRAAQRLAAAPVRPL